MRLIERRIGLLFAGFLVAFLLIVCRAFWLQGVEASQLSSQALDQQTETVMVPGLRGSILDRNGTRLASSEDAATIVATPYLVKKPQPGGAEAGADPEGEAGRRCWKALTTESGFSYLAKDIDLVGRGEDRKARDRRDRTAARQPPHLPAGGNGGTGDRRGRLRRRPA